MEDWRFRDTIGILIVLGMTLAVASAVDGIAQALVTLFGIGIALLWMALFFFEGYTDAIRS